MCCSTLSSCSDRISVIISIFSVLYCQNKPLLNIFTSFHSEAVYYNYKVLLWNRRYNCQLKEFRGVGAKERKLLIWKTISDLSNKKHFSIGVIFGENKLHQSSTESSRHCTVKFFPVFRCSTEHTYTYTATKTNVYTLQQQGRGHRPQSSNRFEKKHHLGEEEVSRTGLQWREKLRQKRCLRHPGS